MIISENNYIKKPYILLDWNVIKYLKSPRSNQSIDKDKECFRIIEQIGNKYAFPFCESHLLDLRQSYSQENLERVNQDLKFLSSISKEVGLGIRENDGNLVLIKCSAVKEFNDLINVNDSNIDIPVKNVPQHKFNIDMATLEESHPLYQMLKENNGIYTPEIMASNLNEIFYKIFDEVDDYKNLRNIIPKLKETLTMQREYGIDKEMAVNLIEHMTPFINSMEIDSEDELVKIWKNVCTKYLGINGKVSVPYGELLTNAYIMLDLHPLFKEKLKKKNTLGNITRDSKMVLYASGAKYFVTEDGAAFKKMSFLFKAFNEQTKILNMEMFIQKFS
ncbi:hypothetical protein GCM10007425_31200 [Lysinibacillus alkalisoli]|uniref:Uncharacterized protein n=1 Tax=Lysinibacillus alkalisoli TaxID=1911548 RepID=A0A917GAU8_9BACI|nr:hypothetical protein [Lysinibacillus alkalisoli]GGG34238.1 hypothetical protein GCM10007425_31200 [Lysinibacillus alkalisoli]